MSRTRPLPVVAVEVDGARLDSDSALALGEVRVRQGLSLPALCELTFYEPVAPFGPADILAPGSRLRVAVEAEAVPLFTGEVTAVEHVYGAAHGHEIRVRAYDLLHRLRKRQEVRVHVQVTLGDLIEEFVADLGLSLASDDRGPLFQRLIQHRQSDLELVVQLAEECGLYLTLREDVLHLITLEGTGASVPLSLGESLLEARIEVSGEPATRSVNAAGWNLLRVETHEGEASRARSGRDVPAEVPPTQVGGPGTRDLVNEPVQDTRHLEAVAQAELDRRVAREVTLWGVAEGNPRLRPGTPVEVAGIAEQLAGQYVLTAVTHTIDGRRGFVSELSTAPPPPHARPGGVTVTLGVVSRVDDPDGLGRIQVTLPTYGRVETGWMHVLSAGAGRSKGLMALPDVEDRVLVLFSREDPSQGIVLGSLYGMEGPLDSGVEGTAVRRYSLLTPGGQRIRLDDARNTIRIEDAQGSYLELSPEAVCLHAAVDLQIEAPGRPIVIRGQTIDFARA